MKKCYKNQLWWWENWRHYFTKSYFIDKILSDYFIYTHILPHSSHSSPLLSSSLPLIPVSSSVLSEMDRFICSTNFILFSVNLRRFHRILTPCVLCKRFTYSTKRNLRNSKTRKFTKPRETHQFWRRSSFYRTIPSIYLLQHN